MQPIWDKPQYNMGHYNNLTITKVVLDLYDKVALTTISVNQEVSKLYECDYNCPHAKRINGFCTLHLKNPGHFNQFGNMITHCSGIWIKDEFGGYCGEDPTGYEIGL
jgi:hypothetical protein